MQVVLASENRTVLSHGVGGCCCRFAEVAAEGTAEVRGTPLGAVDKRQGAFKAVSNHLRAKGLAGMGRVDH